MMARFGGVASRIRLRSRRRERDCPMIRSPRIVLFAAGLLAAPAVAQDAPAPATTLAVALPTAPPPAPAGPLTLTAKLAGDNDVMDPDGNGLAKLTLDGTKLCYDVDYHRIAPVTSAQVQAGKGGAAVATLKLDRDDYIKGCTTLSAEAAAALAADPKGYTVTVLTTELPKGAIAGQLGK